MKYVFTTIILCFILNLYGQNAQITGKVIMDDGSPAIGATVELLETDFISVTDVDGTFSIEHVDKGQYTMSVQYIGMKTVTQSITIDSGRQYSANIQLEIDDNTLDDVTITAKTASTEKKEQAIQIESIEIKNVVTKVKDLTEVIDQMPGVRVRTSGSMGDRADINLNGLNGTAVRTYVDGMPLEFIFPSGSLSNVPLTNVKRIDVYKGVVPIDVGTDAMGGGINIISDYKPYNFLRASYGIGSFNTHQFSLSGNYALNDKVIFTASGSHNSSDNDYKMKALVLQDEFNGDTTRIKRFHDGYRLSSVEAGIILKNMSWSDRLIVKGNFTDFYKEIQNGGVIRTTSIGESIFEGQNKTASIDYSKRFGRLKIDTKFALGQENNLSVDTTTNVYSWSGKVIAQSRRGEFRRSTNSKQNRDFWVNRTNLKYQIDDNTDLKLSNIYANMNINGRDEELLPERDILLQDRSLIKNVSGVEIKRDFFNKLEVSLALKNYYYKLNSVDILSFTPQSKNQSLLGWYGSAKYNLTDRIFFRGSYEKALRIPTFVQFFGNGNIIKQNTSLDPETSDNYNLGFSIKTNPKKALKASLSVNGFIRSQEKIIFLSGELTQQYINVESVDSKGIEAEINVDFLEHFQLSLNATTLKKTYAAFDSTMVSSIPLIGTDFPNTPSTFGNVRLTYRTENLFNDKDGFMTYVQYKHVDEFNFLNQSATRNNNNWIPVQHRVDAGLTYSILNDKISISANVFNVLDRDLFDNFKIPRPGRSFNLKFIYKINNI